MMREEFEKLTGFYPSGALYIFIEAAYASFDGDKTAFCKAYKGNENGIAEKIQWDCDMDAHSRASLEEKRIANLDAQIASLQKKLDAEQEWKPFEDSHNVAQADYERLASSFDTRKLTDEEARSIIVNEYGFSHDLVTIIHVVSKEEVNRHHQVRRVGEYERTPLYNATDWNYIRFSVRGIGYEMNNGQLSLYFD